MKLLAIESSCDETGAAVVELRDKKLLLHSTIVATSMQLHSQTGGIIPEIAAREQSTYMIPVVLQALQKAHCIRNKTTIPDIDAIAVTYGPGLIGSLLVGVETAKTLSYVWNKPLIPVNHLFGHIYANFLSFDTIRFPLIALIVSGAHTDLLLMKSHTNSTWLGGTRDDAAGECFDKVGRMLGLSYPAGPAIEKLAHLGNPKAFHFPRPLIHDNAFDFSFSGLKTAVLRAVEKTKNITEQDVQNLCRGVQDAIIDVVVSKTIRAAKKYGVQSILLSGGVAANQTLKKAFLKDIEQTPIALYVPQRSLCTDNAAMIGAAALYHQQGKPATDVSADPELYFE